MLAFVLHTKDKSLKLFSFEGSQHTTRGRWRCSVTVGCLLYVTKKHYNLLYYHRIQCTVIDLIMKKYALIFTYVTVPIKRTILMPIYRDFSKKSKLARQITDIKIIPAPLPSSCVCISIFLQLSEHYMSGRKLQGRYDKPCTDPFGP